MADAAASGPALAGGGFNAAAGRDAILKFLAWRKLLPRARADGAREHACAAKRVFGTESEEYPATYQAARDKQKTLRLKPLAKAKWPADACV